MRSTASWSASRRRVMFASKPQLADALLERAHSAGIRAAFVAGGTATQARCRSTGAGTPGPVLLSRLIAIAVTRWRIKEDHQLADQSSGLDAGQAVPVPRAALMAGSRGPHAETAIPPSPNAVVTVHRQRTSAGRPVPAMAAVTGTLPPAPAEPTLAGHRFRPGGPLTGDDGLTTTTQSASPQTFQIAPAVGPGSRRKPFSPEPAAPQYLAMVARHLDSAGHEIVAHITSHLRTMTRRWPEAGCGTP